MVDTGYVTTVGKIVQRGTPIVTFRNVQTATNFYAGRLAIRDTNDYGAKVSDALSSVPIGWIGYEHTSENFRKEALSTIYTANDEVAILSGGGFSVQTTMAAGCTALQGDYAIPWSAGTVAPAVELNGQLCVRVVFSKNTSQTDTSLDVPTGVAIGLPQIFVTTAAGSSTITVGLGNGTETGFDADGLVTAIPTTAAGLSTHNLVDATDTNLTSGALIEEVVIKDATGTPVYTPILKSPGLVCDGTLVSLDYTTSNHTIAGYILLPVASPGIVPVGKFVASYTASASTQTVIVESLI